MARVGDFDAGRRGLGGNLRGKRVRKRRGVGNKDLYCMFFGMCVFLDA